MSSIKNYIKRALRFILRGEPRITTIAQIITVKPNELFIGKKILITGGGSGIGYAMAKNLAAEGATIVISGRNEEKLKQAAQEIGCKYCVMDITNVDQLQRIFIEEDKKIGGFDCLINNAGLSLHESSFEEVSIDNFDKQFNTNFRGAYFLTQSFVNRCKEYERKNCKIIFISSQRGTFVDNIPYGLTKATINSLVQGLAYDLIKDDIRVYGLAPGATVTDLIGFETNGNLYYEINRTKRLYIPEEVAEVANFLLTDRANCLSGNILVCDEGRSINTYKKI